MKLSDDLDARLRHEAGRRLPVRCPPGWAPIETEAHRGGRGRSGEHGISLRIEEILRAEASR